MSDSNDLADQVVVVVGGTRGIGGGRMIVTGSGSGHENLVGLGMYGISKAAVSHLVRQLAIEWRSRLLCSFPTNGPTGQIGAGAPITLARNTRSTHHDHERK